MTIIHTKVSTARNGYRCVLSKGYLRGEESGMEGGLLMGAYRPHTPVPTTLFIVQNSILSREMILC